MNYYIFPYSSDTHSISFIESSGRFEYTIKAQDATDVFAGLTKNDVLVGYCVGTQQGASFVLKIRSVSDAGQIVAEKMFEIGNVQVINAKYSTMPPNVVYGISKADYDNLLKDFFSLMIPEDDSFTNDTPIEPEESSRSLPDTPKNLIYFGAPGTGKSNQLKRDAEIFGDNSERVTFYPNYSYAQFVGTYKPVMQLKNSKTEPEGAEEDIAYTYVPGPFIRQWIKAQNTDEPVLLIIEELNRANAPAVFGDMFQLLDRKDGESEYPVATSEDLRKYLKSLLPGANTNVERDSWEKLPAGTGVETLKIPKNLYIWATMNSADQGVFPLDTAFKRRWDYKYFSVYDRKEKWPDDIDVQEVVLHGHKYEWGTIREKINDFLAKKNVNEDKFIGPYFISDTVFSADTQEQITKNFIAAFNDKVIMYLFEDAARQYRKDMFQLTEKDAPLAYSKICKEFKDHGFSIFRFSIPSIPENADTANEDDDQK